MSILYSLILIAFLLTACDAVSSPAVAPTPLSPPDAKATAIVANAAADAAVIIDSNRQIQQAAQNNAKLQETQTAIAVTQQAQSIALVQATIDAAHLQSTQTAQSIHTTATMDALSIISTENQVTTTQAIRAAEVDKKTSPGYTLLESQAWPALVFGAVLIILAIAVAIIIVVLGVSARGHVAKKFEAGGQVWFVPMIGRPVPLLLAGPTAPPDEDPDQEPVIPNTVHDPVLGSVLGNPNTGNPGQITVNSKNGQSIMRRYDDDEVDELKAAHKEAVSLLRKVSDYYRMSHVQDTGEIPRYKVIAEFVPCDSVVRSNTCNMLKACGLVSVTRGGKKDDQGTEVLPPFRTVNELLKAILNRDISVYPMGIADDIRERIDKDNDRYRAKFGLLISAAHALPQREAQTT